MEIVDAQIHDPGLIIPWEFGDESRLAMSAELAREALDCLGIDAALVNSAPEFAEFAATRYPDRFAGVQLVDAHVRDVDAFVAGFRDRPGMLALRVVVKSWKDGALSDDFRAGRYEPLFVAAEANGVPMFIHAATKLHAVAELAVAHPKVTWIVDHIGLEQTPGPVAEDPWADVPEVVALAGHRNVALKLSGAITLSREPYPHRDLWPHLHPIIDAFGADRVMWASDFTRMRLARGGLDRAPRSEWAGIYSNSLGFLRDTDELSDADKEQILGGTVRRLLRWPQPTVSTDLLTFDPGIGGLLKPFWRK